MVLCQESDADGRAEKVCQLQQIDDGVIGFHLHQPDKENRKNIISHPSRVLWCSVVQMCIYKRSPMFLTCWKMNLFWMACIMIQQETLKIPHLLEDELILDDAAGKACHGKEAAILARLDFEWMHNGPIFPPVSLGHETGSCRVLSRNNFHVLDPRLIWGLGFRF